jgi:hypothetical protein
VIDVVAQNRECQVADYPNHKAICRSNAAMLGKIKGEGRKKEADSTGPALDRKKVENRLKQWIQVRHPSPKFFAHSLMPLSPCD